MTAVDAVASWDPEAAISAAKELIHASNYAKVNEARETLDNTIAEWVRVASTDATVASDAALKARAVDAILKIWSLYAALEIELRQFKQATKVFESGASCPFAGPSAPFWLQYAEFCVERKKLSNARKVFVRALRAVPEADHGELWTRFHAFVVEHLDPNMTLASLQAQVFPDKDFSAVTAEASKPVAESQSQTVNAGNAVQKEQPASAQRPEAPTVKAPVAAEPRAVAPAVAAPTTSPESEAQPREQADVPPVDPSLAFVDKRGVEVPIAAAQAAGSKRKASDVATESPVKQAKVESLVQSAALATDEEIKSFLQLPTTLPVTPGCPHLLFDQMETQRAIDNELLERLSTILSDSAVFQGVKDLFDNQRQRDRDMLYRWQDLVGMQMKEGSELFARHAEAEKGVTEPRELIELKNKHLEARREFVHRCQMSQQQFIEISEMDRSGALKAQQISLENMKIPEMTVTTDANLVELQRAIIGLILEAEKLSREESAKKSDYYVRGKKPNFVPRGGPGYQRSDSRDRDRDSYPRGGGRGGRGGYSRGGGSFGRNGGGRRPFSPPRGGRGPPKRHDGYAAHSAPAPRTYDAPPRQTHPPAYQGNSHRNYAQGTSPGRGYGGEYQPRDRPAHFDRGQDRRPQTYGRGPPRELAVPPPHRYADAPPAHSGPPNDGRYDSQDTYRRPAPHAGGRGGRGAPPPARHVEYDRGDRYGAPQHAAPIAAAPVSRYGGEPPAPPQRYSAPPASYDYAPPASTPYAYQSQPPPQQQPPLQRVHYAQPAPVYQQPPPQQQQHYQPPPQQQQQLHQPRGYDVPPPSYQQPPPQHHVQQPAHHQPPHHRPQHQTSPPRGGGRGGYDRFRRGGGGGGRYNRRY